MPPRREVHLGLGVLLTIALLYGVVTVVHNPLPWAESDTSFFARSIASVVEHGSLRSPDNLHPYGQGFAYQGWAAAVVLATGVSVVDFVAVLGPMLGCLLLAVAGYAAFTRFLRSASAGFIATAIVFLVPEIMFSVLRGNHEKILLPLTLVAALALIAGLPQEGRADLRWRWGLVYLVAIGIAVSTNAYFGASFVVALTGVLLTLSLASWVSPALRGVVRPWLANLGVSAAVGWAVTGLVMFVVYPPAGSLLQVVPEAVRGLRSLVVSTAGGSFDPSTNPYSVVARDWISTSAYHLLTVTRWFLFLTSFVAWLAFTAAILRRPTRHGAAWIVVVGLYGAFGALLALAIPMDLLPLGLGANLQVRMYVYFALFSAPMASVAFVRLAHSDYVARPGVPTALAALFAVLLVTGYLKAVNDPLVSNVWRVYDPTEVHAVHFFLEHEPNRLRSLWIGPDRRLRDAFYGTYPAESVNRLSYQATGGYNPAAVNLSTGFQPDAPYALDTRLLRSHLAALRTVPAPPASLGGRAYDNGDAVIRYLGIGP